jgi:hypothetical protein
MSSWNKVWFLILFVLVVTSLIGSVAGLAKEVGYVNILNGQSPIEAFTVERQGQKIFPKGVYTTLEEGDLVAPSPEAMLMFTPTDTACEAVEIRGEFSATACPVPPDGLKDMVYDFVANEFLAAPDESVGVFATRGAKEKRLFSLPPRALRLYVDNKDLAASLKRTPFLVMTGDKDQAETLIIGQEQIKLLSPRQTESRQFNWTTEGPALRQALRNRINFQTIANLNSPGDWPDFEWTINIYTEGANGSLDHDGRKWILDRSIKVGQSSTPISVKAPCVLTFNLVNRSSEQYYVYLVNYTPTGMLLPLLPSPEAPKISNQLSVEGELALPHLFLELSEKQENVRLIISENPLDISLFNQGDINSVSDTATKFTRLRPAPEKSWHTIVQNFEFR